MAGQPRKRARQALEALEAESAAADGDAPISDPPDSTVADKSQRDKPPRRNRSAGSGPSSASAVTEPADRRPASIRKIEDGLQQSFMLAGLGLSMMDAFDGQVIALNSRRLARAWADLAQQNAQVRKTLEALLGGSAWGAAIGQTVLIALPIMVRHGYAPMNFAAMAASNGVEIPVIEMPEEPAPNVGPGNVGPQVPPSDEVMEHAQRTPPRHPMDGSPLPDDEPPPVPPDDVTFPRNTDVGGKGDPS